MCLIMNYEPAKIAKEDITVYKVFRENNRSPFFNFDYTSFISKRFDDPEEECIIKGRGNEVSISKGFIHSFSNLTDAAFFKFTVQRPQICVIRKCIIPAGTKYYISNQESLIRVFGLEIASKSLIIGEIVHE